MSIRRCWEGPSHNHRPPLQPRQVETTRDWKHYERGPVDTLHVTRAVLTSDSLAWATLGDYLGVRDRVPHFGIRTPNGFAGAGRVVIYIKTQHCGTTPVVWLFTKYMPYMGSNQPSITDYYPAYHTIATAPHIDTATPSWFTHALTNTTPSHTPVHIHRRP